MATLTTLRPDGTGTLSLVNDEGAGTTDIHLKIDDDPDSPTTTDYVKNSNDTTGDKTAFFLLTATDADFSSMITLSVDIDLRPTGFTDDTCTLFARMYQADEATTLSNEITVATQATAAGLVTAAFTGLSAGSKAIWDDARIRFRWAYARNMAADGATLRVTAVELDGTYVPQVDVAGSDTATLAEATTLSADLSLADTAALTEQITALSATLSAADSATLTERAEIGLTATDSALLAEQATLLASPAASDSATLSETALIEVEPTRPDTPLTVEVDTGVRQATMSHSGVRQAAMSDSGVTQATVADGGTRTVEVAEPGTRQVAVADSGVLTVDLDIEGLTVDLTHTGVRQVTLADSGVTQVALLDAGTLQVTLSHTGIRQVTLSQSGEQTAEIADGGTLVVALADAGTRTVEVN